MKTAYLFAAIVITLFVMAALSVMFDNQQAFQIEADTEDIADANYCETADDCVSAGSSCQFGCNVMVNEKEVERIKYLLEPYQQLCEIRCAEMGEVLCIEQKCVSLDNS